MNEFVWVACCDIFAVCITDDGRLAFCGQVCLNININKLFPKPYEIESKKRKKFVFSSSCPTKFCALDSCGEIYVYNSDPREKPLVNKLPISVYDVSCGYSPILGKFYAIAITVAGQVYGSGVFFL